MSASFALLSPAKGRMGVATAFLTREEFAAVNAARRGVGLSRALLLQVAALHAYRRTAPPGLARVFNVIYDNTPDVRTFNNCFRSMPLIFARSAGPSTFEACRDAWNAMTRIYERPCNRHAFLLRSLLVAAMPLRVMRWLFPRTTRAVQHYISYVLMDSKTSADAAPGLNVWGTSSRSATASATSTSSSGTSRCR